MNGNNDANALMQRQVLGGILTDILGGAETIVSDVGDGVTSAIGGVTSAVGSVLTPILPTSTSASSTSPPSTTSSTPTVSPTTTNVTFSTSTFDRSSSSSTPTPTSSSTTSSATSTSEPVFETITTSNGQRQTVFVTQSAVPTETSAPPPTHKSFLQNKPLSGFVFALTGVVALVIIILLATFTLRRQRKRKLTTEALSYEPTSNHSDDMEQQLTDEKNRTSYSSGGSGSIHGYGPTGGPYDQNRMGGHGAGFQYPNYAPRSPDPVYDRSYGTNINGDYPSYAPRSHNPAYDAYAGGVPQVPQLNVIGATPISSSMLSGSRPVQPSTTSPPPAAVTPLTRVPSPPQLPATFGNSSNRSIDERQQYFGTDLKVANQ